MGTTNLLLDYMSDNQTAAYSVFNQVMNQIDMRVGVSVINLTTNTPPVSPTIGDIYVVGSSPTGAWAGKALQLAGYYGGQWTFFAPPKAGFVIYNQANKSRYSWDGTAWGAVNGLLQGTDISVSGGGTATINFANGNFFKVTASGNFTFVFSNFPTCGMVTIDARSFGGRTITWPGTTRFPGGVAPTFTSSGRDMFDIVKNADGDYYVRNIALNF